MDFQDQNALTDGSLLLDRRDDPVLHPDREAIFCAFEKADQLFDHCFERLHFLTPELAFPNLGDPPSRAYQSISISQIARNIGCNLLLPELCVRARPLEQMAVVAMPEAALHLDHGITLWENDIGPAREPPIVQDVAVSQPMKGRADH